MKTLEYYLIYYMTVLFDIVGWWWCLILFVWFGFQRKTLYCLWTKEENLFCCSLKNYLNKERMVNYEFCTEINFSLQPRSVDLLKGCSGDTALLTKFPNIPDFTVNFTIGSWPSTLKKTQTCLLTMNLFYLKCSRQFNSSHKLL